MIQGRGGPHWDILWPALLQATAARGYPKSALGLRLGLKGGNLWVLWVAVQLAKTDRCFKVGSPEGLTRYKGNWEVLGNEHSSASSPRTGR